MLWLDTETYSEVPITNGTYAYASDCEVMIFTYALDDEKVSAIDLTNDEHPYDIPELKYALSNPTELVTAHNAMFDRNVLRFALNMEIAIPRWRDTMVQAFTLSLPGSLDKLCDIYRIGEDKAKLKDGAKLIQLFCKPRPKNAKLRRATRLTHPEDWARFIQYAINDTEAMRAVAKKMPTWNYKGANLDYWHLDQKVNDRGILIDLDLARAALRAIDREQASLRKQTHDATNGAVSSTTKRDALLEHILQEYGISMDDLQKDTVERLIDDPDLPDGLKELLKIRLQASMASTSKYTKLIKATNSDGRLRGTIQFRGAGRTGRASGRTFQPQNLPRPNMKSAEIERGIEAMKLDCADLIYGNVMSLASNAIRGCIIAPPGKKLVIADLSNIEGRALAYLAEEKSKLDAFRRFDTVVLDANGLRIPDGKGDFLREGEDIYKVAYAKAFGVPASEATGDKRQIGKVMELFCFAPNTQVLTNNGVKDIVAVSIDDKIWDGVEWVSHKGVLNRGLKETINLAGTELTPDHLILTGRTWKQAKLLASSESILCLALETGSRNLPLSVSATTYQTKSRWSRYLAPVVHRRILSTITTYVRGVVQDAVNVRVKNLVFGVRNIMGMLTSFKTLNTVPVYSDVYQPALTDVETRTTGGMLITARGVSRYSRSGYQTVKNFCDTLLLCLGGTRKTSNWIGLMSIKVMNLGTYVSYPTKITRTTKERYKTCKRESSSLRAVYDLYMAGPRNRFTIITDRGPLIVHNCGYEGGVGAYITGAATYRIDLDQMTRMSRPNIPDEIWNEAVKFWHWSHKTKRPTYGLSHDVFCACDSLKRLWRLAHPNIVSFWREVADAVVNAIREPDVTFLVRKLKIRRTKEWLLIALPSGRCLCYPSPRVDNEGKISYEGVNQYVRKWGRINTYSGKLVENIVQAFSCDVFYHGKLPAEEAGYEIILEVHDEFITEVPDSDSFSAEGLSKIMSTNPPWAEGMPIAAAGFETYRYKKG